jgi:hypothetical protein
MTDVLVDACNLVATRLHPNQDIICEIQRVAKEKKIGCGVIVCLVGSLEKAVIRRVFDPRAHHVVYDPQSGKKISGTKVYDVVEVEGPLEIVSATGTVSRDMGTHVHVVLSNGKNMFSGHLLEGSLVYTTVEMFILMMRGIASERTYDPSTGHKELTLRKRSRRA